MMIHTKPAAAGLCLALICVVPVLWSAYKEKVVQRKLADSARQYRVRAEHGDADAQCRLGSLYYYGKGVPQDYAAAIRWYRKSADQGVAKAQYALGYCYFLGQGVPPDHAEAIRWTRRAAGQGDARAQCSLAASYAKGLALPQDAAEAIRWYQKAADQGDATGQKGLGYMYEQGQGVPQNYTEAARWYRKAAEQGDAAAQWYLGQAYGSGQGVPQDQLQALHWRLTVIEHAVIHCTRRIGWTPWLAIMLALASFAVWRHSKWLSWAVMAVGCAIQLIHVISGSFWSGLGRILVIALFTVLSATGVVGAVMTALNRTKPGSAPSQPSAIS
jgi:hypothetical protein